MHAKIALIAKPIKIKSRILRSPAIGLLTARDYCGGVPSRPQRNRGIDQRETGRFFSRARFGSTDGHCTM
jgi:hypothetical protein